MVENAAFVSLLALLVESFMLRFAVDNGEKSKQDRRLRVGDFGSANKGWDHGAIGFASMRRPKFGAGELVFFVRQSRHGSCDHLTLEAGETPCLCSKLYDPLDRNLDAFFLSGIGEVLDSVDNLLDDCAGSSVDALLRATARESSKQCLLAPDGFLSSALVSDMVAHGLEE